MKMCRKRKSIQPIMPTKPPEGPAPPPPPSCMDTCREVLKSVGLDISSVGHTPFMARDLLKCLEDSFISEEEAREKSEGNFEEIVEDGIKITYEKFGDGGYLIWNIEVIEPD